jgi:hypothetical protein
LGINLAGADRANVATQHHHPRAGGMQPVLQVGTAVKAVLDQLGVEDKRAPKP